MALHHRGLRSHSCRARHGLLVCVCFAAALTPKLFIGQPREGAFGYWPAAPARVSASPMGPTAVVLACPHGIKAPLGPAGRVQHRSRRNEHLVRVEQEDPPVPLCRGVLRAARRRGRASWRLAAPTPAGTGVSEKQEPQPQPMVSDDKQWLELDFTGVLKLNKQGARSWAEAVLRTDPATDDEDIQVIREVFQRELVRGSSFDGITEQRLLQWGMPGGLAVVLYNKFEELRKVVQPGLSALVAAEVPAAVSLPALSPAQYLELLGAKPALNAVVGKDPRNRMHGTKLLEAAAEEGVAGVPLDLRQEAVDTLSEGVHVLLDGRPWDTQTVRPPVIGTFGAKGTGKTTALRLCIGSFLTKYPTAHAFYITFNTDQVFDVDFESRLDRETRLAIRVMHRVLQTLSTQTGERGAVPAVAWKVCLRAIAQGGSFILDDAVAAARHFLHIPQQAVILLAVDELAKIDGETSEQRSVNATPGAVAALKVLTRAMDATLEKEQTAGGALLVVASAYGALDIVKGVTEGSNRKFMYLPVPPIYPDDRFVRETIVAQSVRDALGHQDWRQKREMLQLLWSSGGHPRRLQALLKWAKKDSLRAGLSAELYQQAKETMDEEFAFGLWRGPIELKALNQIFASTFVPFTFPDSLAERLRRAPELQALAEGMCGWLPVGGAYYLLEMSPPVWLSFTEAGDAAGGGPAFLAARRLHEWMVCDIANRRTGGAVAGVPLEELTAALLECVAMAQQIAKMPFSLDRIMTSASLPDGPVQWKLKPHMLTRLKVEQFDVGRISVRLDEISQSCIFRPEKHDNEAIDSIVVFERSTSGGATDKFLMLRIQNKEWGTAVDNKTLEDWRNGRQRLDSAPFFKDDRFREKFEVIDVIFSVLGLNSSSPLQEGEAAMDLAAMQRWCPTASRCTIAAQKLTQYRFEPKA